MIISTGSNSKRFGDVCYTFVIFSLNISDFIVLRLVEKLSYKNFKNAFLLIVLFNCLAHFFCVYVLIGSRIVLVLLNPSSLDSYGAKNSNDLKEFVPMRNKKGFNKLVNKLVKGTNSIFKQVSNISSSSNN